MQYRTLFPAVLALVLAGGVARAQSAGTPGVGSFGRQTLPGALGGGSLPGIPASGGPLFFQSGGFALSPTFANQFPSLAGNGLVPIGPLQFQSGVGFVPSGFVTPFAGLGPDIITPNGPLQYVPGVGYQATFATPAGLALPTSTGVTTVTGGFLPSVTNLGIGYGGGGYGPYYSGQLVGPPVMGYVRQPGFVPMSMANTVPVLGITAPPLRPGIRTAHTAQTRVSSAATIPTEVAMAPGTQAPRQLVAGRREELRDAADQPARQKANEKTPAYVSQIDSRQVRLANRMEDVMENRPLTEGEVVTVGATGVLVRYEQDGEVRTVRFRPAQVFFFQKQSQDARLASAETDPDSIKKGDRVLIPLDVKDQPRTSTAAAEREARFTDTNRVIIRPSKPRTPAKVAARKPVSRKRK